jgi:hypothetical protein
MEKQGVITDETPREDRTQDEATSPGKPVTTKQAADDIEDHASKRAADAVTEAAREG